MDRTTLAAKKILLVDDEPFVRKPLAMALRMDAHQITEVATAEEALLAYQPGLFDLIITDYSLPGMCGDELAAAIKNLAPTQPIILITAWAERCSSETASTGLFDQILPKPISIASFRQIVASVPAAASPRQAA